MKLAFAIISGLIIYGSLYPFSFSLNAFDSYQLAQLFDFDIRKTGTSDLVANLVLFIPFGLLMRASFPSYQKKSHLCLMLLLAGIFAFAIQFAQLWTNARVPWGGDAVWNIVGTSIGLVLYTFVQLNNFSQLRQLQPYQQVSFALACIIVAFKLAPFAPSLDIGVLKDNIKLIIRQPTLDWYWVFEHTVKWLIVFFLLQFSRSSWASLRKMSVLVAGVLTLSFIVVSSDISLSRLLAGLLALTIWGLLSLKSKTMYIAPLPLFMLMLLVIIGNGLHPFELRDTPASFNWVPFGASIGGNTIINIIAVFKKLIFYSTLIWLFYLYRQQLRLSILICASVAILSETLQIMFTESVPDSTDLFLVMIIAVLFNAWLKSNANATIKKSGSSTG